MKKITREQYEFNQVYEYLKRIIEKKEILPFKIFEKIYSYVVETYMNEYVGYFEIFKFLEALQNVEVNAEPNSTQKIRLSINELRQKCIRKTYEKEPIKIKNLTINHIDKLNQIIQTNTRITFNEYNMIVENYLITLLMQIEEIDYANWNSLLLQIEPKCRIIKEIDEVKKMKQTLYILSKFKGGLNNEYRRKTF